MLHLRAGSPLKPPNARHLRNRQNFLHQQSVSDQAHRQTFNLKRLTRLHRDHGVVWVLGQQFDTLGGAFESLYGYFLTQPGNDDLPVASVSRSLNSQQVAIHDACIPHGHAAHLQQVIRLVLKKARLHAIGLVYVFLRENGRACGNPTDQWQKKLRQLTQWCIEMLTPRCIECPHCVIAQTDPTGRPTDQFDNAFAGKRLQMLFCRVGGFEAQLCCNFGAGRGGARLGDSGLNQVQNLLLACRKFGVVEHGCEINSLQV